ncbi:MAG: hypothetical protein FJ290_20480 [Planctomycetes bacterium]|nr:hypothetical protein [Planctomycetota bacterium]
MNKAYMGAVALPGAVSGADTRQYSDADVLDGFSRRVQLRFPAKLAVYERTSRNADYGVRDNEAVEKAIELLKDDKRFYQAVVLAPTFIRGDITPTSLRRAAAEHRADLTLLCESDFQVHVRPSIFALLDLTILGAFLFPSQTIEVESRVTAHLLDTRNGLIYHSTLKKQEWKGLVPTAWGRDAVNRHRKELAAKNYEVAVKDLKDNLGNVERLAAEPTPDPPSWRPVSPGLRILPPRPRPSDSPIPGGVRYETPEEER